jgi:anti-sigma factor ChrR (cupin superfamily)
MELNADFSKRVLVHADAIPWVPSPTAGVERRMLDRIGDEVARATSIVRYAPDSHFPAHTHGGGEEFLVLEGVFQDEHGDYPAGYYIRNPPTSRHHPGSGPGCTILVKLWQFNAADRSHTRIDTRKLRYVPLPGRPGVEIMSLYCDSAEDVRLERWSAGATIDVASHGGIELFVLDGTFEAFGERLRKHSWLRVPPAERLLAKAGSTGCTLWLKSGHLQEPVRRPMASG